MYKSKYNYNREYFKVIDTEDKAYWAGFIAADGNVRRDLNKMRIELNIKDIHHLEKFRENLNGNMPIRECERYKNHSCYIEVNSVQICKDLNKIGITPNKSLTLDIDFSQIPNELIHHFIRGYFDGDGSISHTVQDGIIRWQVSFIGTETFLNKVQFYLNKRHQLSTAGSSFRFGFTKFNDVKDITNYMYKDATVYLDRKYEKFLEFDALNDYQAASY